MNMLQKVADKPPVVTCTINVCIATAHWSASLGTVHLFPHRRPVHGLWSTPTPCWEQRSQHPRTAVVLAEKHQWRTSHAHPHRDGLTRGHVHVDVQRWD